MQNSKELVELVIRDWKGQSALRRQLNKVLELDSQSKLWHLLKARKPALTPSLMNVPLGHCRCVYASGLVQRVHNY